MSTTTARTTSSTASVSSAQVAGSHVQYMAGMVGPMWLTVGAAGLFACERPS